MELIEYLRVMGKRLLIPLILPAVALVVALLIVIAQPTQYSATATVRLPVPTDAAASVITQANSDFGEALGSSATTTATSRATRVAQQRVNDGLSVSQSGGSRFLDVTYLTTRKGEAQSVVKTASETALTDLLQPEADMKRKAVEQAKAHYDDTRAQLDALSAGGATLPDDQFRAKINELGQLQVQLLQAQASDGTRDPFGHIINNRQAIQTFTDAITRTQADIAHLEGLIASARPTVDAMQNALTTLGTAQRELDTSRAAEASANGTDTIVVTPTTKVNKTQQVLQTLGVVAAVAVVLSVALLILLELLRPSSRRKDGTGTDEDAATADDQAPPGQPSQSGAPH